MYSPRIYTYKITFEEVSYYYYGSKKERVFNEEYWGSPVTNKWYWELYTPKKQILEIFDYTDEGYEECRKVENRLIKPFLNHKWCLNEHCGGSYSIDHLKKIGKRQYENKVGIHTQTIQDRIEMGKKIWNSGKGLASISKEQWKHNASLGGATGAGGKVVGNLMKMQKRAIFSLSSTQLSENAKKAAAQKWKCTITGHISNAGGLARYQKSRKIDISNRIRLS